MALTNSHSVDYELSSSQYSTIVDGSQSGLDVTGNITIEGWFNFESLSSVLTTNQTLVSKYLTTDNKRSYILQLDTTDKLTFTYSDDGTFTSHVTASATDSAAIVVGELGTWIHYAVTVDVATQAVIFYKDLSPLADTNSLSDASSIFNSDADFRIGARGNGDLFYDGKANNIRVWNVVRSLEDLTANYQKVLSSGSGLVGSWYANNNHNDLSGNGNNLTAVNTPTFSTSIPFEYTGPSTGGNPMFFSSGGLTIA